MCQSSLLDTFPPAGLPGQGWGSHLALLSLAWSAARSGSQGAHPCLTCGRGEKKSAASSVKYLENSRLHLRSATLFILLNFNHLCVGSVVVSVGAAAQGSSLDQDQERAQHPGALAQLRRGLVLLERAGAPLGSTTHPQSTPAPPAGCSHRVAPEHGQVGVF